MKKLFVLLFLYCFQLSVAHAQINYWQQKVNYKIDVALNDVDQTLDGNVAMEYYNNSPDTLHFIWIQLWANAYKNDRTAFSDQLLENGSTDSYFSTDDKRGYINRLNFTVNGTIAKTYNNIKHQDIIKLVLPQPILPNTSIKIETPFHVKLPYDFSGDGHINRSYQITQWYPKPAVYDSKGWHEIPYLNEGANYSEFGDYEVRITLPKNYVIAATGELQTEFEKEWLANRKDPVLLIQTKITHSQPYTYKKKSSIVKKIIPVSPSIPETKTLVFQQNNIHDFVWFADKKFIVQKDSLKLNSGKIINIYSYHLPSNSNCWTNNISFIKRSLQTRSEWLGDYPYNIISVVETPNTFNDHSKYPELTTISNSNNEKDLARSIDNGIGESWNYGALESNEIDHLWMNDGINNFYNDRFNKLTNTKREQPFCAKKMSSNFDSLVEETVVHQNKDQPIETISSQFSHANYYLIADVKTTEWMSKLEHDLGKPMFDSCMHEYYRRWQFKHPYPEDLKKVIEDVSGKNVDSNFVLLYKKGELNNEKVKKRICFTAFYNLKNTDKYQYISIAPAIGYNNYDKVMLGAIISNYTLPHPKLQFTLAPLYATESKIFNGIGKISYSWYPKNNFQKIELGINGERFSTKESLDTNGNKVFESFYKIVPSIRFYFNHSIRSNTTSYLDFRTYFIGERFFDNYTTFTDTNYNSITYPISSHIYTRYLNQITFNVNNSRVLYPYDLRLQLQQGSDFYRLNLTANYFYNYVQGGGLKIRLFAAKFGYIGNEDFESYLEYGPKLAAGNGEDDYTYNSYFLGRTASYSNPDKPLSNQGIATQQLLIQNTGGLKFRFDQYPQLQGQSQNWVAALNFNSTVPNGLLPAKIPLTIFFDIGTYAEAWGANPPTSTFLYTGGLQLSLFKNVLNIYAPLIWSSDFNSTLKSDPLQNTFLKKISFSINVLNIKSKGLIPAMPDQILFD